MKKMQVMDIKEENIKKMFNNKALEQSSAHMHKPDHSMNLDKRIHKILGTIKSKNEPIATPDHGKKDSYRSSSTQNKMDKDNLQSNNTYERSTTDTFNSHSLKTETSTSIKNLNSTNLNSTTTTQANMSEDRSIYDSNNENKNLSDKFKAKRNIINCANKIDNLETNRPQSAPVKK